MIKVVPGDVVIHYNKLYDFTFTYIVLAYHYNSTQQMIMINDGWDNKTKLYYRHFFDKLMIDYD